jgi:hypothetical protein
VKLRQLFGSFPGSATIAADQHLHPEFLVDLGSVASAMEYLPTL